MQATATWIVSYRSSWKTASDRWRSSGPSWSMTTHCGLSHSWVCVRPPCLRALLRCVLQAYCHWSCGYFCCPSKPLVTHCRVDAVFCWRSLIIRVFEANARQYSDNVLLTRVRSQTTQTHCHTNTHARLASATVPIVARRIVPQRRVAVHKTAATVSALVEHVGAQRSARLEDGRRGR